MVAILIRVCPGGACLYTGYRGFVCSAKIACDQPEPSILAAVSGGFNGKPTILQGIEAGVYDKVY